MSTTFIDSNYINRLQGQGCMEKNTLSNEGKHITHKFKNACDESRHIAFYRVLKIYSVFFCLFSGGINKSFFSSLFFSFVSFFSLFRVKMYIRIKRQKTTWFLQVNETEKVSNVKKQLTDLLPGKTPTDLQFQISGKQLGTFVPLEDDNKLDQLGIIEDSILYLCLWIPNESLFFIEMVFDFLNDRYSLGWKMGNCGCPRVYTFNRGFERKGTN